MPKASTFPLRLATQMIDSDTFPALTNAGENVRLPVSEARQLLGLAGSATVNAYNEVGATNEIKIQAAISRAISTGRTIVFIPTSLTPYNASLVTFDPAIRMVREGGSYDMFDLLAYGATGDGSVDDTAAVVAAVAGAGLDGGIVFIPTGIFKTTSTIYSPRWVSVLGISSHAPGKTYDGLSILLGIHTGPAVLSLKGALGCRIENVLFQGDETTSPKTGLCLGRGVDVASAGSHFVTNVNVSGFFSEAAVYLIASEENSFINLNIYLRGGGAMAGLFMAQGDSFSVDSLSASSNLNNVFHNIRVSSEVMDDDSACIMIHAGSSSGDFDFFGGYLLPSRGAYVFVTVNQDAASMLRGMRFYGLSGEINTVGSGPIYGFRFGDPGGAFSANVDIMGTYMPCAGGGNFLKMDTNSVLADSRIKVPTPINGSSYITSQFVRSDVDLGAGRFIFGDIEMIGTNKLGVSGDNTSGLYFGDPNNAASPRLRHQSVASVIQLLNNAGTVWYDMAVKDLYTTNAAQLIRCQISLNNGAGAGAGTITNAPAAGNPTKWVPIDDNGTTRYIPAW